jgi:hypothetical protein
LNTKYSIKPRDEKKICLSNKSQTSSPAPNKKKVAPLLNVIWLDFHLCRVHVVDLLLANKQAVWKKLDSFIMIMKERKK